MVQEIHYGGMTANTDARSCPDGDLVSDLTGHTVKWCNDDTSNEKNYAPVTFEGDVSNLTNHFVQARDFSQTASDTLADSIYALVNSFVAEHSTNKGRFMYPFLIRYALRLYDGTIVHHSSPVLMLCCTGTMPHVFFNHTDLYESPTSEYVGYLRWGLHDDKTYIAAITHDLYYMCDAANISTLIDKWSDIVKSLDIFISAPIYTYNPNGRFKRIKSILYQDGIDGYSLSQWGTQGDFNDEWHDTYQGKYTEQLHSVFSLYGASPDTKLLEQTRMLGAHRGDRTIFILLVIIYLSSFNDIKHLFLPINS
ncbi:MAG: hypothetical protein LUC85_08995 [Bacteroidales bacterium]|nr:hypothetical protein [Bacteroidales bacterium]MCD8394950.1 hypothetical protein [Bacteroidales bacterium]